MGKSYVHIHPESALELTRSWVVTEASSVEAFNNSKWRRMVVTAELEDSKREMIFKLDNGEFVKAEAQK